MLRLRIRVFVFYGFDSWRIFGEGARFTFRLEVVVIESGRRF